MKAIVYDRYGPPDVARSADIAMPEAAAGEILVRVGAASVSTADWRMRASAFPGGLWLVGRLVTGLFRPRHRVLGTDFAGEVAGVGPGVTRFRPGDRVFGFSGHGAHAEYLAIAEDAAVARTPEGLSDEEAAALPFGAIAALVFLRDFAAVRPGERVLIVGASGGVGAYAVQIARAMGAHVTGVASAESQDLIRALGAHETIDYARTDFSATGGHWDVILDTVRPAAFGVARRALSPGGRYVPLNFGLPDMIRAPFTGRGGGPRMITTVNGDRREDVEEIAGLVAKGALRPVIDSRYPLDEIRSAYARVESRRKHGAVILTVAAPAAA